LVVLDSTLAMRAARSSMAAELTAGAGGGLAELRQQRLANLEALRGAGVEVTSASGEPFFARPEIRAAVAALRSDGFVMGIREPLHSTVQHANATSVAAKFGTAQGARDDVEDLG